MKKYQIIYADPPWQYDFVAKKENAIESHYPTMTQDELKALQIPTTDNAVLFLWATAPKLLEAIDVLKAWGFTYKTQAVWDKDRTGLGYWFLGQHELLLVGTKGKFSPPEPKHRRSSVFKTYRAKHSKKPATVRMWIADSFPEHTKLELFCRKEDMLFDSDGFEGWDVWGNEVESDIEL